MNIFRIFFVNFASNESLQMDITFSDIIAILPFILIPIISALVGWVTNVLALKMTFFPLEYIGVKPFGWQGIIPSKAQKMATISVDLMTSKLVNVTDIFSQVDPKIVSDEMQSGILKLSKEITDEIMLSQAAPIWKNIPQAARDVVYYKLADDLPEIIEQIMLDIKTDITSLFDLKALVLSVLKNDKALINQIFLGVGKNEFRFIELSGLYFGFLFGLVQMAVFFFYDPWWILPVFGLIVGFATNYLAIKLIFRPINPIKLLGITFQGVFLKRQNEVADEYAKIITARILTTETIFDFILRGPSPQKFSNLIKKQIDQFVHSLLNVSGVLSDFLHKNKRIENIKNIAHYRLLEELPISIQDVFNYADDALDIKNILSSRMKALSKLEFEQFLRPVFKEDEFKLILIGAFLGALAGLAQYFLFFY